MEAFAFGHIALIALAVVIGLARVVAWILDWREHAATASIREQAFIAQAHAEIEVEPGYYAAQVESRE